MIATDGTCTAGGYQLGILLVLTPPDGGHFYNMQNQGEHKQTTTDNHGNIVTLELEPFRNQTRTSKPFSETKAQQDRANNIQHKQGHRYSKRAVFFQHQTLCFFRITSMQLHRTGLCITLSSRLPIPQPVIREVG